ncbi:MAG: polyribonucleotide nucleotidyltransferase [Candidatus Taylorbacteria bacterium]|nr:polyribonucleotide nucleotidyltransferase [Candidatus Taylorbacteria bacterium]
MHKKEYSIEVGGERLIAEFNDLADQAHGSVLVRYGNTIVLGTAVMSKEIRENDFFPLTVEYEERFYASGKILGSRFARREGRPSDEAILSGRLIDRTLRPLFDQWIRNEVQVVTTVLSIGEHDPDVVAIIAASLSLGVSNIPWNGPVSAVRITKNKEFEINPTYTLRKETSIEFDMVACGKDGLINMIEVAGKETDESLVVKALQQASKEIEKIQTWQQKIISEIGVPKKNIPKPSLTPGTAELFAQEITPKLNSYVFSGPGHTKITEINDIWLHIFKEKIPGGNTALAQGLFDESVNTLLHTEAIENSRRADGRELDEIRPLFVQAGKFSPVLHGSGIFYRGGTHILSILTLGGPQDSQIIDGAEITDTKRFMHHYNFPPFSTGETGRIGGLNRRMVGHGALAEKALVPVLPDTTTFPYTIRLVSEALASNGSTSMGSVCASTLSLMDGGVPISAPVAGIASGLMMREKKGLLGGTKYDYKILTDIQGPEDHHGDMDFKVAGTRKGITAIQMDVKVNGIPLAILEEAFKKAQQARYTILDLIEKELPKPRKDISSHAPKILALRIKQDQIGLVIGGGGKTINDIKEKTGVDDIAIEDDGTVYITGKDTTAEKARDIIESMTHEFTVGEKFEGEVTKILDFGAFVRISPTTEGLVHISEIAPFKIDAVASHLKEGQKVPVIIKEIDERKRINLSIKMADPNFIKQ